MIPGEEDFIQEIREHLDPSLARGEQILTRSIKLLSVESSRCPQFLIENKMGLHLSRGLLVKACKLFRSTLAETAIGADEAVQGLSRTLFETATAMGFLTATTLRLHGEELSAEERAQIYSAHRTIEFAKTVDGLEHVPAYVNTAQVRANSDIAKTLIGRNWTDRLQKYPWTYSGLKLPDLSKLVCKSLGDWYGKVYPGISCKSHALDAAEHVLLDQLQTQPRWHQPLCDLANNFRGCAALFTHTALDYGTQFEVSGFEREHLTNPLKELGESVEQLFATEAD